MPALAQTAQPTPEPTPVETPAPTPEAETPVEPVVVPVSAFDKVVDLLIAVVLAGGGVAAVKVFRDPERGKQFVTFGLELLQIVAKLTPTTADDAALTRLNEAWQKALAGMVEAKVTELYEAEKERKRANEAAQRANEELAGRAATFAVVPPDVKA